ncbi:MAG TPA: hypothetical protein VNH11_08870 [Pirellulales bacterium]|nr:hypothetical protein [Pirellulales bacterium]
MEITIELGRDDKNINPFIEPLGEARRGKWRRSNLPAMNLADAELAGLPDLPGYRVAVDTVARKIRVFDPLQQEKRRATVESALRKFFKRRLEIEPEQVTHDQPLATLQRWLVWMHRLVEARNAKVVEGRIPDDVIQRVAEERNADAKRAGLPPEGNA